jgi:Tol biopolymer transport system component
MRAAFEKTTRVGKITTLSLGLAAILAALLLALAGAADPAEAKNKKDKNPGQIVFASDRTTGTGVNNPTGDDEIFTMNPDGTELKQLTFNTVDNFSPTLSPDGKQIAYKSLGVQSSNPEGDDEVYLMNALDGLDQRNLTNTAGGIDNSNPDFSPDGQKIVYDSDGNQSSNPEGDDESYKTNANGSDKHNITDTGGDIDDVTPDFGEAKKG